MNAIYVVGSINTDMVVKTESLPRPGETVSGGDFFMTAGGKGANQAVAAARLGGQVVLVGSLGTDVFGDQSIARLQQEKIACENVARHEASPSGVALITVDAGGENQIAVAPGANNYVSEVQVTEALARIPPATLVLLQLEIPLTTVARVIEIAQQRRCRVILDPAPAQALASALLAGVYLLTPNETEAEMLTGITVCDVESAQLAASLLLEKGVEHVAVTLGAAGVLLANESSVELISSPSVKVLDTTGAGDCFNGSLATALSGGLSLRDSVHRACQAAAISVTRMGAQDAMPYFHEVELSGRGLSQD